MLGTAGVDTVGGGTYAHIRAAGAAGLRYEHRRAPADQLLGIPDAIAWCWSEGRYWRRRIAPVVAHVRDV